MRRRAVWATLAFIALSALVHLVLGGSLRLRWPAPRPVREPQVVTLTERTLRRPPSPVPSSPTPRPTMSARRLVRAPRRPPRPVLPPVILHRRAPVTFSLRLVHEPEISPSPAAAPETPLQPALPEIDPHPTPIDARDIIVSARFVKRVDPDYPAFVAAAGIEGTVIVLVTVAPDGSASDFRVWVSSGNPALDRAALEAAERSTYAPPEVDGVPAYQTYRIIESFERP